MTATSPKHLVELNNVYLKTDRGGQLFNNLSFRLPAGQSAIIIGPAGSGKTSLVEMLVGRRWPQSGSIEVTGQVLRAGQKAAIQRVRRAIGGVGGLFGLIPSLTVAENITFPLIISGERRKVRRERLLKVLTEFALLRQASEYPETLTRVEYTLVQFARATIAHQPLLLIDEPLAGLDQQTYQRILNHLMSASLSGKSMIILCSDALDARLPNTSIFNLRNGALQ